MPWTYYLCCQENCTCLVSVTAYSCTFNFDLFRHSTRFTSSIHTRLTYHLISLVVSFGAIFSCTVACCSRCCLVYSTWYSMLLWRSPFSLKQNRHNLKMISDVENSWRIFCVKAAGVFEIEIQFRTQLVAFSSYVFQQIFVYFFRRRLCDVSSSSVSFVIPFGSFTHTNTCKTRAAVTHHCNMYSLNIYGIFNAPNIFLPLFR